MEFLGLALIKTEGFVFVFFFFFVFLNISKLKVGEELNIDAKIGYNKLNLCGGTFNFLILESLVHLNNNFLKYIIQLLNIGKKNYYVCLG